jgi:hypothetical protein
MSEKEGAAPGVEEEEVGPPDLKFSRVRRTSSRLC